MLYNPVTKWMKSNILLNTAFKHTCEEMMIYLTLKCMTGSKLKVLSGYESLPTVQKYISPSVYIILLDYVDYSVKRLERHQTEIWLMDVWEQGLLLKEVWIQAELLQASFQMSAFTPRIRVYHSHFPLPIMVSVLSHWWLFMCAHNLSSNKPLLTIHYYSFLKVKP